MRHRSYLHTAVALTTIAVAVTTFAAKKKEAANQMDEHKRALHALNRLTFGPLPGEAAMVEKMGVDKWIEQQLHPEKIDDSRLDARLAPLRTLNMSTRDLMETFPSPQMLKAVADGKQSMSSDPAKRAIYESAIARYEAREERKTDKANSSAPQLNATDSTPATQDSSIREGRMYAELDAESVLDLPPDQRYAAILKMPAEERAALGRTLNGDDREQMLSDLKPQQRETLEALQNPQRVVIEELEEGKLLRDMYSERQLQEVMTDFWFNHFNVFINKGPDRYLITSYERDVIRPRALGKFKDLLLATAHSPAMLFYLDNWQSVGPASPVALGLPARQHRGRPRVYVDTFGRVRVRGASRPQAQANQNKKNQQRRGLNENYAREVMELHTLGVDGGYTQKDVTELAKILTGWTLSEPRKGGGFEFNERMHEPGKKIFLGKTFHEDGENEGTKALEMLAKSPATAHFVSKKLAMRFVADDPPSALVERMAQKFESSDGDIREVLRVMFHSPEFRPADDYRAKIKTPLEFVVSAVRATGAEVTNPMPLVQALNRMGMPLYGSQPPTGYSMKASAWVNSAALINRMNFALALGNGHIKGVQPDQQILLGSTPPQEPDATVALLEQDLLNGDVSSQTHAIVEKQLSDPQISGRRLDDPARPPNYGVITGLILGSPEFQRR